jgi:hypothetical protein
LSNRTAHLHWYSASSPRSTNTKSHGKLAEYLHWRGEKVVRSAGEILSARTRNISVFFFLGFLVLLVNHMSQIAAFRGANPSRAHPGENGMRWLGNGGRECWSAHCSGEVWRKRRSGRGGQVVGFLDGCDRRPATCVSYKLL